MTQLSRILLPGEGESVAIGTTTRTTFKAVGRETDNRIGLFEHHMAPGAPGASPHLHRERLETFYVLDGVVEMHLDGRGFEAPAGSYVQIPENTVHGFRNPYGEPATMLILFSPDYGHDGYFKELSKLTANGRKATEEELIDLMTRYDQYEVVHGRPIPSWGRH